MGAEAIGEELRALAIDNGDMGIEVAAHVRLGHVAYYRGISGGACLFRGGAGAVRAWHARARDIAIAPDPPVAAAFLSLALAHLGYIEQAISYGKSAVEDAEKLGLSSPAFPLILSVWARTLDLLGDIEQCAACSTMLVAVCEEQGFSYLLAGGQCQLGGSSQSKATSARERHCCWRVLPPRGQWARGSDLRSANTCWQTSLHCRGNAMRRLLDSTKYWSSPRATGACSVGRRAASKEGRALLASAHGNDAQAELEFRHAIDIARSQSARLFELRAATCLARLWSDQGDVPAAQELLRPIYGWFSEGPEIPGMRGRRVRCLRRWMRCLRQPDERLARSVK